MNCNETFNAGVCYVTDAYKSVCRFNEELHADLEKYRTENAKLQELVRTLYMCSHARCDQCEYEMHGNTCVFDAECELRELGVEV